MSALSSSRDTSNGRYRYGFLHLHQVQVEVVASTHGESCAARGLLTSTFWLKLSSGGKGDCSLRS
eukprot:5135155-Alexandrium_andersonii.AAC.1